MDVRKMRMSVDERVMLMHVGMRFGPVPRNIVSMPMVLVMPMRVFMSHRLVRMHMFVALGNVKIDAQRHERPRRRKLHCQRFMRDEDREHCTEERRAGEIGARARGAQVP